ncbi:hypothetical protein [Kineosporia babensis]|uniref:Uncharacterized protein n=1 Tax=Kineosporia babensis TaxID=499548 RepID=A0A9X1SY64_9ACTN|nr:hypothetical protein [Kineosporia babensis]MCD5316554.1 hypothetical protein [Kineosporia babensis]
MSTPGRFLVLHDYGMGGLWWWVHAPSAEAILEAVAEVEVITDPETVERVSTWDDVAEVSLDASGDSAWKGLVAQRTAERQDPDYGKLIGQGTVYLRSAEDGITYLTEVNADGIRTREVGILPDGRQQRSDDWPLNPAFDLRSPELARQALLSAADFEAHWQRAEPVPDHWD